jgi:hypothetical protein
VTLAEDAEGVFLAKSPGAAPTDAGLLRTTVAREAQARRMSSHALVRMTARE